MKDNIVYFIISWFFIYSFLGWVWESAYVSVKKRKLVNRGFIYGPLCTIYGMGAVSVYLILEPFEGKLLALYVGGVLTATVLEYITGWLMEKIFHTRWWDYSDKKYNLHGYICLGSSVAWGFFTLLLFKVLHPFVSWLTSLYPIYVGKIALVVVTVLYGIDFVVSASAACSLSQSFAKAEDLLEEITIYLHNSKLYETKEEIREKLESARSAMRLSELTERMYEKKEEFLEQFEQHFHEKHLLDLQAYAMKKEELEQRLEDFTNKYLEIRRKQGMVKQRMVHAYPELKEEFQRYREKHQKRIHKSGE